MDGKLDVNRLFQRMADVHDGKVEALVLREDYAKIRMSALKGQATITFEMIPVVYVLDDGETINLVKIQYPDFNYHDTIVSPIPSVILAVVLHG